LGLSAEEAFIRVRLPKWIVEEVHRRGLEEDAIAKAAIKLALLEEIISKHGLEEEDLEWIRKRRRIRKQ
jgi:hypothetical protein